MIRKLFLIFIVIVSYQLSFAANQVKIAGINGDVNVRRGVEETWQTAILGMLLDEIDTIQTGENSQVTLKIESGKIFKLNSVAQIDISELRRVSEKEMQLYLMSKKIGKIEKKKDKTPLRVGNVSVVHGLKATENKASVNNVEENLWRKEANGAKALFDYKYYTNTVIKLNKILSRYSSRNDCGEIHYYLGRSFEVLKKKGQAIDAYEVVINSYEKMDCSNADAVRWYEQARKSIKKLK
jgi:hypothetical protein